MAKKKRPKITKKPEPKELQEKTNALDKEKTSALKKLQPDIARLYEKFFLSAKSEIGKLPKDGLTSQSEMAYILKKMDDHLVDAGIYDLRDKFGEQMEGLTAESLAYFEAFGVGARALAGLSPKALDAFIIFKQKELVQFVSDDLVGHVGSVLFDGIFGNLDRSQIYESVSQLSENLSMNQVIVMVDDAFAGYQRTVQREVGEELGMEIYVYLGPDDEVTSEQCQEMLYVDYHGVPGMLYKDEITVKLHPKLRRDPLIGGGHPRCRHHWSPITLDYAIEQGFEP